MSLLKQSLDGSVTEAEREELREDCRSRYEEIKKKEIVNVPFELHINGKVVLNSELKLKLKDYDPIISECYAFILWNILKNIIAW